MFQFEKVFGLIVLVKTALCTVAGLTYMDSLRLPPAKLLRGEDPCKPLYWYPRQIPDYCYYPKPVPVLPPVPMPVPVPISMPMPMFMPLPGTPLLMPGPPLPMPGPPFPMPGPPLPMPGPALRRSGSPSPMPGPPLPIPGPPSPIAGHPLPMAQPPSPMPGLPSPIAGSLLPIAQPPSPMPVPAYGAPPAPMLMPGFPGPGQPYPVPAPQIGLVPGVNGLVSPEGGINILPFSDVYSDLLEKHKQKMIRIRLQNLLDEYEYPQKGKRRKCRGKHGCSRY